MMFMLLSIYLAVRIQIFTCFQEDLSVSLRFIHGFFHCCLPQAATVNLLTDKPSTTSPDQRIESGTFELNGEADPIFGDMSVFTYHQNLGDLHS